MSCRSLPGRIAVIVSTFPLATLALADEPGRSPADWITHFNQGWDETAWTEMHRAYPGGYMRPQEDAGWRARFQTLQGLVRSGKAAVPTLLDTLQNGDVPARVFAAQTLGFLAPDAPADKLVELLKSEPDRTVRLYLVDAIGMHGAAANSVDWDAFLRSEKDRDVKRHVSYVQERDGKPVDPDVIEQLKTWDASTIASAVVGQPAPDFTLKSVPGATVKLSDYRGKQAVVLVFIYGDT